MIVDTSVWIDYFRGDEGADLARFRLALNEGRVVMAPVVLTELLSSTEITADVEKKLDELSFAEPSPSFWKEGGKLRRRLARLGFTASLADCLVAQSCLERGLPLLTRDKSIQKFAPRLGLALA